VYYIGICLLVPSRTMLKIVFLVLAFTAQFQCKPIIVRNISGRISFDLVFFSYLTTIYCFRL